MENASRALSIAGAVLIGVLVLALVVTFYYNLSDYEQTKSDNLLQVQTADFNRQFYAYQKDLYGSEVFSLANKINNYNIKEANEKGYTRIDIIIKFSRKYESLNIKEDTQMDSQTIANKMENLSEIIKKRGETILYPKKWNYSISQLSNLTSDEIEVYCKEAKLTKNQKENVENKIKEYEILKTDELTIKSKQFQYINSTYDNTTGRITSISFKEI